MTIIRTMRALALLAGAVAPAAALADPVPGFRQLETVYHQDGGLPAATAALAAALPPGTDIAAATRELTDAGAGCKSLRRDPDAFKCLIHQYSFADRSADDVRWTITLHARAGALATMNVDRYVDRHGH